MGGRPSSLSSETVSELVSKTKLGEREIYKLYKRFKQLDGEGKGYLRESDFLALPELSMNPLCKRLIRIFDREENGRISFVSFVITLATFSKKADVLEKLLFLFKLYDIDDDGVIHRHEVKEVFQEIVGENLPPDQIDFVVAETFFEVGISDPDDPMTFDDFARVNSSVHFLLTDSSYS